jgi:uncharacterized protein YggE
LTVAGTGTPTARPDHVQQGFALTCTHAEPAQAEAMCQEQANAFAAKVQEAGVAQDAILVKQYPAQQEAAQYRAAAFIGVTLPITDETAATVLETLVKVKQVAETIPDVTQQRLSEPVGDYPGAVTFPVHPQSAIAGLAWFTSADWTVLEAEALRQAYEASQKKAERAAAALGWQIIGLKNLTVGDSSREYNPYATNYEEMRVTLSIAVTATYQVKTGG